ncbi:2-keto-4-pentenoate hydratase/2-oxohepta-3-ene-1,7-dioic acid hydratase in catechol pathway [Bradyrhizobium diazoefficiens]
MKKTTRRDLLATAAAATAASIAEVAPAAAQAGPKPIFPVPMVAIPIVGETQVFQVRRIYCIGRNYAAHAIERGSDPNREPPFFFQKPTGAIQNVAVGEVADHPYPSLTKNYHHEVETGCRAEIRRHQYPGREGARPRLWLRARSRHDPARSPERHGRGEEAVGNRQEL